MAFNQYPYTDFHELNLDWILNQIKKLENQLTDFIKINTVKYEDPIIWNITTQYEANTVVIDGSTGNAYISTIPVPIGVNINNTDYWTGIFNYEEQLAPIREDIANEVTARESADIAINERIDNLKTAVYYNVKDYGAVGDGQNDDTEAIQSAIAAASVKGGCIYFPSGTYKTTETITVNRHGITVLGEAYQSTYILSYVDERPAIEFGDGSIIKIGGRLQNISLANMRDNSQNATGVFFNYNVNVSVTDVVIGGYNIGLKARHTGNSSFTNVGVTTTLSGSIGFDIGDMSVSSSLNNSYVGFTGAASDTGIGLKMNNGNVADFTLNYFDVGNGETGVLIDGINSPADFPPADIRLHEVVIDGVRRAGIELKNINARGSVYIEGGWINPLANGSSRCIILETTNNINIQGVTMQQLSGSTPNTKGLLANASTNVNIIGNMFIQLLEPITLSNMDICQVKNNQIKTYVVTDASGAGISLTGCWESAVNENHIWGTYSNAIIVDSTSNYVMTNSNFSRSSTIVNNAPEKSNANNLSFV